MYVVPRLMLSKRYVYGEAVDVDAGEAIYMIECPIEEVNIR